MTPHPRANEAKKLPSRAPTRTTGLRESYTPKLENIRSERDEREIWREHVLETTIDDDTDDGGNEATVQSSDTVRGKSLPVDIDQAVELAGSSTLGGLGAVGQTSTSKVEGVDEKQ